MTRLPISILKQINELRTLGRAELLAKYKGLCPEQSSKTKEATLRKAIAYRLQEAFYGGLSDRHKKILDDAAANDPKATGVEREKKLLAGTKLLRVWQGKCHEVVLRDDGKYEYDGRLFKSLSAIAREITGTRWNGKTFFGVKK